MSATTLCGVALELLFGPFELVAGKVPVLLKRLEIVAGLATDVAHGDLGLLRPVLHDLHELLAPLLCELREHEADDRPSLLG